MMTDHLSRWELKKNVDLESLYFVAHFLIQLFLTSETKSCAQANYYEFLYFLKKCVQYFNNQLVSNSAINKSEIKNSDSGHKKCTCIYKFLIKGDFVHLNSPIKMSDTQPTEKKEASNADRRSVSRSSRIQAIEVQQPLWQRRDSFSSCSSDSAVYCSSQHGQANNYQGVKRPLPGRRSDRLAKRHRHSSGSSASSNVSCLSEKDPKNIPEHPPTPLLNNAQKDVESAASPLPQAKSSPIKVQTVIEERISYACKSEAGSPYRHNLRRNIKKKACCNCDCGASRTTVVVRRFTQIRHEAVEESRDLATHKTTPSPQLGEPVNNTFIHTKEASCDSETYAGNKKRRREVDKLYDALHEIKWASHFSPDNILSQIDVRRAASCSMFSPVKSNVNTSVPKDKALFPKKECLSSRKVNLQKNNVHNLKKDITELNHTNDIKFNTDPLNNTYGRVTRQQNHAARETSLEAGKLSKTQISAIKQKQLTPKKGFSDELLRCNSKRDIHISMQPVNKKEESFFQTNKNKLSPKIYNSFINSTHPSNNVLSEHKLPESTDCLSDQNESNCLESVWNDQISTQSNCLVQTKTNLSRLFKNSKSTADTNQHQLITTVTEQSELNSDDSGFNMNKHLMRATFLDISGQAIQAIDACFQEIVGEVEVTTSEMSPELPHLTSVNEVSPVTKRRRNEKPPLLELCASTLPECNIVETDSEFAIANLQNCNSETIIMSSVCSIETTESKLKEKASAPSLSYSQFYSYKKCPSLNQIARKRILKKYLKYLWSKSGTQCKQSECISRTCVDESVSALQSCDLFNSSNTRDNAFAVDENDSEVDSLTSSMSNEKYRSFSSKSVSPQFEEFNVRSHLSDFNTSKHSDYENALAQPCRYQDMESENITNHTFFKSSHMTYHSDAGARTSFHVDTSRNVYEPFPKVNHTKSSFSIKFNNYSIPQALPKVVDRENENKKKSHDDVVRHSIRFGFTFHYKAITVNRNDSYTQILLRITRGKRIFLTHEALLELKDAVNAARNDTRCQVLIINGSGDSFCSGLDLRPLIGSQKSKAAKSIAVAVKEFIEALADFHKPLVAVVNGAACGLGVTILNHSDVSIASDEATFCMPYPYLGYTPEGGATLTLPQAVGATVASDMLLRGRVLTAREACDAGLVCEVLPAKRLPYELVDRVRVLVDTPSTPLQTTKQLVRMRLLQDLRSVLEDEVKLLPRMWLSSDCQGALHKVLDSGLLDH